MRVGQQPATDTATLQSAFTSLFSRRCRNMQAGGKYAKAAMSTYRQFAVSARACARLEQRLLSNSWRRRLPHASALASIICAHVS